MGLSELKEEILADAKKRADAILSEGKKEADESIACAKDKCKEATVKYHEETKKLIESFRKKEISSANTQLQRQIAQKKKELLDSVFAEALLALQKDAKKRTALVKELAKKAEKQISIGTIYCNKEDMGTLRGGYTLKESAIAGGIIAESKDGGITLDYSFETVLAAIKEKHMTEVSKLLFEGV